MKTLHELPEDTLIEYLKLFDYPSLGYSWQFVLGCHDYEDPIYWQVISDSLCLFKYRKNKLYLFLCPLNDSHEKIINAIVYCFDELKIKGCESFPIEYLEFLPSYYRIGFNVAERHIPMREFYELKGRKFNTRRQDITACQRKYDIKISTYTAVDYEGCQAVYNKWVKEFQLRNPNIPVLYKNLENEMFCKDRGQNIYVAKISNTIVGYIVGVNVTENLYGAVLIKYDNQYRGLYAYLLKALSGFNLHKTEITLGSEIRNNKVDKKKNIFTASKILEMGLLYKSGII
ncbi:MAG TPA: hypothetical protein DC049_06575 [Spirochaetia bacterium]|nr:hypothetical protein [Spirochaetia bacterium]